MKWSLESDRPIYAQLIEQLTNAIVSGQFEAGEKLASVRELAQEAAVNPNTMQKALSEMEREGLVYTKRTAGRYITEDKKMLEKMRNDLAKEQIKEFVQKMNSLGITTEEIINYIKGE